MQPRSPWRKPTHWHGLIPSGLLLLPLALSMPTIFGMRHAGGAESNVDDPLYTLHERSVFGTIGICSPHRTTSTASAAGGKDQQVEPASSPASSSTGQQHLGALSHHYDHLEWASMTVSEHHTHADDGSTLAKRSDVQGRIQLKFPLPSGVSNVANTLVTLQLEPSTHLIHADAVVSVNDRPTHFVTEIAHDSYHGRVLVGGTDRGWARITVHRNETQPIFDGVFQLDEELYTVKPASLYAAMLGDLNDPSQSQKLLASRYPLVVYKESDRAALAADDSSGRRVSSCGADELAPNQEFTTGNAHEHEHDLLGGLLRERRAAQGCPVSRKILYIGLALDCTYVSYYGGVESAVQQVLKSWNQASAIYESTFNIALGVIKINAYDTCDTSNGKKWNRPCTTSYAIVDRLNDFSAWRPGQNEDAGVWHLMTRCNTGATIGIAWIGQVCKLNANVQDKNVVSGTGVSSAGPNEWVVIAHEVGHSLGAQHDCDDTLCGDCNADGTCKCCRADGGCSYKSEFVMNPTASADGGNGFSSCSQAVICKDFMQRVACLRDPGDVLTLDANICGNGIKEKGEQCDCGPADSPECRADLCCDGATCKLKPGAVCSDSNDACCTQCQPKEAGFACRPTINVCDLTEKCDGISGECPRDTFLADLTACQIDGGAEPGTCASGECTSRSHQCKLRSPVPVTYDCPGFTSQCKIVCQSQSDTCVDLGFFYMDGTPCSYSGRCVKGVCDQSTLSLILGFLIDHAAISIGVLIFLVVWALQCCNRCRRTKKRGHVSFRALRRMHPASMFLMRYRIVSVMLNSKITGFSLPVVSRHDDDRLSLRSKASSANSGKMDASDNVSIKSAPTVMSKEASATTSAQKQSAPAGKTLLRVDTATAINNLLRPHALKKDEREADAWVEPVTPSGEINVTEADVSAMLHVMLSPLPRDMTRRGASTPMSPHHAIIITNTPTVETGAWTAAGATQMILSPLRSMAGIMSARIVDEEVGLGGYVPADDHKKNDDAVVGRNSRPSPASRKPGSATSSQKRGQHPLIVSTLNNSSDSASTLLPSADIASATGSLFSPTRASVRSRKESIGGTGTGMQTGPLYPRLEENADEDDSEADADDNDDGNADSKTVSMRASTASTKKSSTLVSPSDQVSLDDVVPSRLSPDVPTSPRLSMHEGTSDDEEEEDHIARAIPLPGQTDEEEEEGPHRSPTSTNASSKRPASSGSAKK